MTKVQPKLKEPIKNENLKNLKPLNSKGGKLHAPASAAAAKATDETTISNAAKNLNSPEIAEQPNSTSETTSAASSANSATSVAKALTKIPVLPIVTPSESKDLTKIENKVIDGPAPRLSFIKKPALIFIEGFSAFGISNGDGIKDMSDNLPGAKRFSWNEQDKIIEEIKKHAPDQPVVLVGHSFGGDSAVEIANTLNTTKNGFRNIDLLVSIDSVGMNNNIIPMNVNRNLNFFTEGVIPFLHGNPNVARNTDYTDVQNELRFELHSKMDDSQEVQFKIFQEINEVLGESNHPDIFIEIQKTDQLKELIGNLLPHLKQ